MAELSGKLSNVETEEERNCGIVECRYGLVDMCFTKLITYYYHFDKTIAVIL
jgi:hypothetical protein